MSYGRTFALTPDGDLDYTENNRFAEVSGVTSVDQILRVTIATIRGEDPIDEEHGLDVFAATGGPVERTRAEIADTVRRNEKVKAVNDVTVERDGERRFSASVDVQLVDGEEIELTL